MPHYPVQKACEHYCRYLQALGKTNSDVHTPGVTMKRWRYDNMVLATDLEKAHPGSGAEWSGVSTRGGDLLTCVCKNAPAWAIRAYVSCHFTVIARVSKSGCDLVD